MDAWAYMPPRGVTPKPRVPEGEPPPPKQNFRTMGRGSGGVALMRGGPSLAERTAMREEMYGPTVSTIPPNFETVLFKGNNESKGFGSRAPRFDAPKSKDEPSLTGREVGPKTGEGTVGVRGHGSFASKAPRLPKRVGHTAAPPHVGPGSYEQAKAVREEAPRETAAFVLPSSLNPASLYARPPLGPGEYEPKKLEPRVCGAVPKTGRDIPAVGVPAQNSRKAEPGPGPGQYASGPAACPSLRDISFGRMLVEKEPPPFEELKESSKKRVAEKVLAVGPGESIKHMIQDAPYSAREGPVTGPGQYEVQSAFSNLKDQKQFSKAGVSAVFQDGKSHFPRSWRPIQPGPTDYDPNDVIMRSEPSTLASVGFKSQQEYRNLPEPVGHAPGPAWYTPRQQEKAKSFHLNMKNKFVP